MDLQLDGKVALVTGGSRGIGKAVALALAREGVDVALLARDAVRLAAAAEEIHAATGRRVSTVSADTGDTQAVNDAVAEVIGELGQPDILVNNAARPGGAPPRPGIEHLPDDGFHEEMNTKVLGYVRCARAVAPGMKERGGTLDEARERMAAGNSVRRIIDASDIANLVVFLASPLSIAINGDSIAAGGGLGNAIYY